MSGKRYRLGDIAPACTAQAKQLISDDSVWLLNLDQIESHTGRLLGKSIVPANSVGNSTHWFDETNVLYSKLRPYLNKVYLPNEKGVCTTELIPLKPNTEVIDRDYLAHYLRSDGFLTWVNAQIDGAKMPRVSMKIFWDHQIYLPSLVEQKRIAAILDKADSLRRKRREALALADDFLRAVFLDMFGDPVTNPKGWPVNELKALGKVSTGRTPPGDKPGMFDGETPFVTPGDLESNAPTKRSLTAAGVAEVCTVRTGATLVCCIGATIGKMGKATKRSAFNQQINAVEWNDSIDDDYGLAALKFFKAEIARQGASTTLPILKKSSFEKIRIPVPPKKMQQDFANRVAAICRLNISSLAALAELDFLHSALQSEAFA